MKISLARYRTLLITYLRPQWKNVVLLLFLLLGSIAFSLANPQIISQFIDEANAGAVLSTLIKFALLFLGVAFLKQIFAIIEGYVAENVSLTATNLLRADLTLHCLRLDLSFHTIHSPGELIERINTDVASLGNLFSRFVVALLGNALLLVGVLIMFVRIEWHVGLVMSIFAFGSMVLIYRLRSLSTPWWEAERQASAELTGFIEERLSGTEDVRSSGASSYMLRGLASCERTRLQKMIAAAQRSFFTVGTLGVLTAIGTALSLVLGVYLFNAGIITIGTVYLIFNYTLVLNTPIEQIVSQLRDLQQTAGSVTRILSLLDTHSTIEDGIGIPMPSGALSVAFQHVSFSYDEGVPVLKDIDFALEPGLVMGLVGRTGSGKSTLTKLIARLYDPQEGKICLGDVDLRSTRQDDLHERIGIVTQEVHVMHTSVRNNLTFFDPAIEDARINEALEILGLDAWLKALPAGLDTRLAPGGNGLSAGEAQLFALARVFLKAPGLVILDEASSRLDPATERRIERAIDRLLTGRTGIIIAHRLATVQRADTIMLLEDGRCCEYGLREKLAEDPNSRFAQLLRTGLEEVLA